MILHYIGTDKSIKAYPLSINIMKELKFKGKIEGHTKGGGSFAHSMFIVTTTSVQLRKAIDDIGIDNVIDLKKEGIILKKLNDIQHIDWKTL